MLAMQIAEFLCDSDGRKLDGDKIFKKRSPTSHSPISLRLACMNALRRQDYSKLALSVSYASYLFAERLATWKTQAPINFNMEIGEIGTNIEWFYIPDIHPVTRNLIVGLVDHHHLFIRVRMALVRGKLHDVSVRNFVKVAQSGKTPLTRAIIVDGLEPQSEDFARITFCQQVEECLLENGDVAEAEFCRLVRNWNRANDEPGMTAIERVEHRLNFRKWLLRGMSFDKFPPKRGFIKGFPAVTFEAILAAIDGYLILYGLVPSGSYNVRSVNTNDNETYHSIVYSFSNSKYGIPDCSELEALQAKIWRIHKMKLDPEIPFQVRTAKNPTYIDRKATCATSEIINVDKGKSDHGVKYVDQVNVTDHFFDSKDRCRAKPRHNPKGVSKWNEPAKGVRGVREFYKVDESKLSMLSRMGISEQVNV